jgi:uncharacterized tellurite resistance protein B-like protein
MPLHNILRLFGLQAGESAGDATTHADAVRKIAQSLEAMDAERARFVAAFAYMLSRVARADLHVSTEETTAMERLVRERAGLPEDQAALVVEMAKHQNKLFGGTEDFLVTREFGRTATQEQKLWLLDCLFAVAASEDQISVVEDNEIRQIASELLVEHPDYIAVRSKYRDQLAVLHDNTP